MKLSEKYLRGFIDKKELTAVESELRQAHKRLERGDVPSPDFLGWLHLPSSTDKKILSKIEEAAALVQGSSDIFIVIGIGGSYLGSRAAIEFLRPSCWQDKPDIFFAGNNMDAHYLKRILDKIGDRDVSVNVISKSGTTTEPAIAFRIIREFLARRYSAGELKKRIIFTTTKGKGALWSMSRRRGYRCFCIPENVGGRFSVLTPAGLLPMAAAGLDIKSVIKGARAAEAASSSPDIRKNMAYRYAALRTLLHRNGRDIEIMASFHAGLHYILEWWKQLFAESEGKDGKGLFPATAIFSTDLHSIGQLIQQGKRNMFETFMSIKKKDLDIKIPRASTNTDNLNYLAGKGLYFLNTMAYQGTEEAHRDGDVPNMTISIDERSEYCLGELFYFFQRAVGISGLLLNINPFDQPGVEAYKKNMFRLLGRPS